MTLRLVNWLLLAGFMLVGAGYLYESSRIVAANPSSGYGPVQFPIALGVLLVVLCVAEVVNSIRKPESDEAVRIEIPNVEKLVATIVLTGIYFLTWSLTGWFYVATGVFYFALAVLYQRTRTPHSLVTAGIVAIIFTTALYLIFGLAFRVQLA